MADELPARVRNFCIGPAILIRGLCPPLTLPRLANMWLD